MCSQPCLPVFAEHQEVISRSLYKVLAGQDRVTGHAKPNPAKTSNGLDAYVERMNHREVWDLSYAVSLIRLSTVLRSSNRVLLYIHIAKTDTRFVSVGGRN